MTTETVVPVQAEVEERIGNMTHSKLIAIINEVIDRRQRNFPGEKADTRTPAEVFDSIVHSIIERKPGDPSTLEMLREDRDR